jgi:hypothetical protein
MKSKFRFWAYFLALLSLGFSVILIMTLSRNLFNSTVPIGFYLLFSLFFLYVWLWMIFGELRSKIVFFEINHDSFNVKRYLGLGKSQNYYFDEMDGWKLSILSSHSGSYEYLYIILKNKKIVKLSEFYHKNYQELKGNIISKNIKNLGFERYSFLREAKEIFV